MNYSQVFYVIIIRNSRLEFHCSASRRDVENLEALVESIPSNSPKRSETVEKWYRSIKDLGMKEIEI